MSTFDRVIRLFLGIAMIYMGLPAASITSNLFAMSILVIMGVAFIIFSFTAHCPVYKLANISTISSKSK